MKKYLIILVLLNLMVFSLSGIELAGSIPDNEKMDLVLGKWETVKDGIPLIYLFTDHPAGEGAPGSYAFYVLKPGEKLTSVMQFSVYSIRKTGENFSFIILTLKGIGIPDTEKIGEIEFSPQKFLLKDSKSLEVDVFERVKKSKGGKNENQM